jgi:hypothetical protein
MAPESASIRSSWARSPASAQGRDGWGADEFGAGWEIGADGVAVEDVGAAVAQQRSAGRAGFSFDDDRDVVAVASRATSAPPVALEEPTLGPDRPVALEELGAGDGVEFGEVLPLAVLVELGGTESFTEPNQSSMRVREGERGPPRHVVPALGSFDARMTREGVAKSVMHSPRGRS